MADNYSVRLFNSETALNSLRDTDFDFATAVGELLDNSLEAMATRIDTYIFTELQKVGDAEIDMIFKVVVMDNGDGMTTDILHKCLQFGYSTRYNNRTGLGRFGVGATYAGISQCKKITVLSRTNPRDKFQAICVDLAEIVSTGLDEIQEPFVVASLGELEAIVTPETRTLVVWENCDRLDANPDGHPIDGTLAINELKEWIARAYRYYIWDGIKFCINGQELKSHDPLYLRPQDTNFPADPAATIRLDETIAWLLPKNAPGTSNIRIIVTLLPEQLRPFRGAGGTTDARIRRIDENEGISILRHKREVAFGNFYPIVPALEDIDRWWGCEIHFEPELDEWWQVRNIKRGARPVEQLRNRLKAILNNPDEVVHDRLIMRIRQEIRAYWDLLEQNTGAESGTDTTDDANQETNPAVDTSEGGTSTNTGAESGTDTTDDANQETNPAVDTSDDETSTNIDTNEPGATGGTNRPRGTPPLRPQVTLLSAREPEQIIERICKRFHLVAQQLKIRYNRRSTLEITDEYDVQDLLHALLKLEFEDVRPEEWTPSYAGGSSRMDFLLHNERIVIEVKKTRNNMNAQSLGQELIVDTFRYQSHPRCRTLICFVYDPDNRIANPRGIENDLSRYHNSLKVQVFITP